MVTTKKLPQEELYKMVENEAWARAKKIDDNLSLYIHKKKWWLPMFIYKAVIKNHTTLKFKIK